MTWGLLLVAPKCPRLRCYSLHVHSHDTGRFVIGTLCIHVPGALKFLQNARHLCYWSTSSTLLFFKGSFLVVRRIISADPIYGIGEPYFMLDLFHTRRLLYFNVISTITLIKKNSEEDSQPQPHPHSQRAYPSPLRSIASSRVHKTR